MLHIMSSLDHTWILDLDGTILKHNGYKIDGKDSFLDGARQDNVVPQSFTQQSGSVKWERY